MITWNCEPEEQRRRAILRTKAVTDGERDVIANLSNTAAVIMQFMEEVSWAGFYIMRGGELVLGPFQGKPACRRIAVGKGVCGTAVSEKQIQLVPDVHAFPGHIACDGGSKSEIVLPIQKDGQVVAVLDMDSYQMARFDESDSAALQEIVSILEQGCDWNTL